MMSASVLGKAAHQSTYVLGGNVPCILLELFHVSAVATPPTLPEPASEKCAGQKGENAINPYRLVGLVGFFLAVGLGATGGLPASGSPVDSQALAGKPPEAPSKGQHSEDVKELVFCRTAPLLSQLTGTGFPRNLLTA
jgi:hypothetical protein